MHKFVAFLLIRASQILLLQFRILTFILSIKVTVQNSPDLNPSKILWSQMKAIQSLERVCFITGLKQIALKVE